MAARSRFSSCAAGNGYKYDLLLDAVFTLVTRGHIFDVGVKV